MWSRRHFVKGIGAFSALGLAGCCGPEVSIKTPLFYGSKNITQDMGAPHPLRVFYPSEDGSPEGATFCVGCADYPLIMFLHGQNTSIQSWDLLSGNLARAGFVVVVPEIETNNPGNFAIAYPKVIDFMMNQSEFAKSLLKEIGICGHSLGGAAGLQAAIATGARALTPVSPEPLKATRVSMSVDIPLSLNCLVRR